MKPESKVNGLSHTAVALVLCLAAACTAPPTEAKPHVLLIVLDTFRADRLGVLPPHRATSPNLDRLAARARVFSQARSSAPFTMPAMAAMLTGHYGDRAGVATHSLHTTLDCPQPTLAERFRAAGYATAAVVSNPWLENRATRFHRGFDVFLTRDALGRKSRLTGAMVTDESLRLLDRFHERPTFLWVHYMDTHMPYEPSSTSAHAMGLRENSSEIIRAFKRRSGSAQNLYFARDLDADEVARTRSLYDAAALDLDGHVGRLLDALEERGLRDRTLVVVTADHGESLGEHGLNFAHDFTLYDEVLRVPLLVAGPAVEPGRDATPRSVLDLVPWLCDRVGLGCEDAKLDGHSLSASAPIDRTLFAASAPARKRYARNPRQHIEGRKGRWTAAIHAHTKLIRIPHPEADLWEAYDLAADPYERINLLDGAAGDPGSWPDTLRTLRTRLTEWEAEMNRTRHRSERRGKAPSDPATRQRLRALGYLD